MRPTFFGFETARKGILVSQKGLDITGHNLTNVQTPGYTRQRVDQVAIAASSYRTRYATNRADFAGQGVDINGIAQIRDSFLDKRFREEYADVGYYDQKSAILSDIESAIDEIEADAGLKNAIQEINNALMNFSNNKADSKTHANLLKTAFKNMTQVLQQFNEKLDNVEKQQKFDLGVSIDNVNSIFEKINNLNKTISEENGIISSANSYYGPNELLDQRNLLLDELAQFGNIDVTNHGDGTVTVKMNNHVVVDGVTKKTDYINFMENTNGTVSLTWQSTGGVADMRTGALKAYVDMINGRGKNMQYENEGLDRGVRYYRDMLDTFAQTLVDVVNSVIPVTASTKTVLEGFDKNNSTAANGSDWYSISGITVPGDFTGKKVSAGEKTYQFVANAGDTVDDGNVAVVIGGSVSDTYQALADALQANGMTVEVSNSQGQIPDTSNPDIAGIIFKKPDQLKVTETVEGDGYKKLLGAMVPATDDDGNIIEGKYVVDPNAEVTAENISITDIWEADASYAIFKDKDTTNKFVNELLTKIINDDTVDFNMTGESFTGTFKEYVNSFSTTIYSDVSFANDRLDATVAIADDLRDRRDEISGVSPDEETVSMMLYQKCFQASARLMTAMDEMLDILINRTGRVGL